MFKFVVLCAFLAAATADPDPALFSPLAYRTPAVVSAPAVYSSPYTYSPSVIAPAPLTYTSAYGLPHLIKKRSLAVSPYIAPTTYLASTPVVSSWTGAYAAPYTTYAGPLASTYSYTAPVAHLIKKRSPQVIVPSNYIARTPYVAPYVASTYAAATPVVPSPYYSAPLAYSHFIKKRSIAPLAVAAYTAPASYSHQSRFDYTATSPAITTTYSSYGSPVVYSGVPHLI